DVRLDAIDLLRATEGKAESGHDLVEDEQRAVLGGDVAQPFEESGRGNDHAHIANDRLHDHRGDDFLVTLEGVTNGVEVVVVGGDGELGKFFGNAGGIRNAQRRA